MVAQISQDQLFLFLFVFVAGGGAHAALQWALERRQKALDLADELERAKRSREGMRSARLLNLETVVLHLAAKQKGFKRLATDETKAHSAAVKAVAAKILEGDDG